MTPAGPTLPGAPSSITTPAAKPSAAACTMATMMVERWEQAVSPLCAAAGTTVGGRGPPALRRQHGRAGPADHHHHAQHDEDDARQDGIGEARLGLPRRGRRLGGDAGGRAWSGASLRAAACRRELDQAVAADLEQQRMGDGVVDAAFELGDVQRPAGAAVVRPFGADAVAA